MVEQSFQIKNYSGDDFAGDLRYLDTGRDKPLIIVCHGFTAHKDWGPFPYFGKKFAEHGFASIVFNFSHNGIGNDPKRFTDLAKFSRNTISKELEDLRSLMDAVEEETVGMGVVDSKRIGIVGHSRGGGVAILSASRDRRIKAVAGWSAVSTFHRYTSHQKTLWEKQGYMPVTIRSMQTKLRYGIEVLNDLEANKQQYDLVAAVKRLTIPLLLVHGEADVTVRPAEAQTLFEASDKLQSELTLVEHTGHMYGMSEGIPNPTLDYITERTAEWFHRYLLT